ncbi:universal stress protein [Dyadobacter koreensis]|nr:universal stress protein [Dyadobacter koreensis]
MKSILVPCNFSNHSEMAFNFALEIAEALEAEIVILTALNDINSTEPAEREIQDSLIAENKSKFKTLLEKQARLHVPVRHILRPGKITPLVLDIIEEEKIDVVIMGTHGSRGWDGFFMGSNIEKIVRTSPVPVFAVKSKIAVRSVHNIVFPISLSSDQNTVIEKVKNLQKLFRARLHLVRINTGAAKNEKENLEKLTEFGEKHQLANFTVNSRNRAEVKDGIIDFAREINADMIAMATHGNRGLNHLYSQSIAADVVNHANFLIWTSSTAKNPEKNLKAV